MKIPPLVIRKRFNASREQVFEAWSNPEIMKLWFKPDAQWQTVSSNSFKVGGSYKHAMIAEDGTAYNHVGEYKEIIPPKKIVFTWNSEIVKDTLVIVELKEIDGQTELTLTHDLFLTEEEKERHHQGWDGCLQTLLHHFNQ